MIKIQKHKNAFCNWSFDGIHNQINHVLDGFEEVEGSYLGGTEDILHVRETICLEDMI